MKTAQSPAVKRILTVILFTLAADCNANLIVNGDFELDTLFPEDADGGGTGGSGPYLTYLAGATEITGWMIGGHSIDMWLNFRDTGSQVVDINGLLPGAIQQTFLTAAGRSYDVSYDVSGPNDGIARDMRVQVKSTDALETVLGSDIVFVTTGGLGTDFLHRGFSFEATGSTSTLIFTGITGGFDGLYVDNIVVAESAVPVPASVWLFGSGLAGMIGIGRRNSTSGYGQ